ncbi:hypothetical protein V6C27_11190 [Peptococcaceae bacterium 1198_IL3148]
MKKRLLLTFATIALGASLVGIANADTISSAINPENQQPAQYQTHMSQQSIDAMNKNMGIDITNHNAATQSEQAADENNKDFINQMNQMHDSMQEVHKNMPVPMGNCLNSMYR